MNYKMSGTALLGSCIYEQKHVVRQGAEKWDSGVS